MIRWTCFGVCVPRTLDYPTINLIRAKVHRIITMHASPRQPDGDTVRQMDEHHGNSANKTIEHRD